MGEQLTALVAAADTADDGWLRAELAQVQPYRVLAPDGHLLDGHVPEHDYEVPLGVARIAREGRDVTLVAWSAAVELCERAADELERDGVSASVLDLRSLVPLDRDTLAAAATRRLVRT